MGRSPFKEFTAKGWPLCPNCEEDELYSFLMLTWTKDEPPSVQECIDTGMKCYQCSWELSPRIFPNCFRCNRRFEVDNGPRQNIYCHECRKAIKTEQVRAAVEAMGWPIIL